MATGTVSVMPTTRGSPGFDFVRGYVSANVALASTTVRFRVSGSVMLTLATAGSGSGVEYGASPKDVVVTEKPCEADMTAADKIGMSMAG